MKRNLLLLASLALFGTTAHAQWVNQPITSTVLGSNLVIRPSVIDADNVWTMVYDGQEGEYTQQFCRTTNGGSAWTVGTVTGITPIDFVTSIHGVSATTAWVTVAPDFPLTGGKLLKTIDGGATWTAPTSSGQFSTVGSSPFLIRFFDNSNGVAIGNPTSSNSNFEIVTTTDGGANWTPVAVSTLPALLPGEAVTSILGPTAQSGNSLWFGTDEGRVYRTSDKGLSWSVSSPGLPEFIVGLAFRDANNGLAVDENGNVARTTNGGLAWSTVLPTGAFHVGGLDNIPGTSTYVSTGTTGEIGGPGSSYSINDGLTWTAIESSTNHTFVDFVSPTVGWSGGIAFDTNNDALGNGMNKYTGVALATNKGLVLQLGVSSYPNPSADGKFLIEAKSPKTIATARVLDELGRTVLQQEWRSPQTAPLQLDLGGRPAGVYVLELNTTEGPVRQKLVVK